MNENEPELDKDGWIVPPAGGLFMQIRVEKLDEPDKDEKETETEQ
jgi:hypothetical protein